MRRATIALPLLFLSACTGMHDTLAPFPETVLWAWERPEHLSFIDPSRIGIAFLAQTVSLQKGTLTWRPRYQPLDLPAGTKVIAVVRIESSDSMLPDPVVVASRVAEVPVAARAPILQIDFDARLSERDWYRTLLQDLRRALPPGIKLNITALASWCLDDPWIRDLPIDDATPMMFRLGAGEPTRVKAFNERVCSSSEGVSLDEPRSDLPHARRIFIFDPNPWTQESYRAAMKIARSLQ